MKFEDNLKSKNFDLISDELIKLNKRKEEIKSNLKKAKTEFSVSFGIALLRGVQNKILK